MSTTENRADKQQLQHRTSLTGAFSSSTLYPGHINAPWRKPRITRVLLVRCVLVLASLLFLYFHYLHRLLFIDYSAFPRRTGPVIIHPGTDPEPSVPPFHLNSDHTILPNINTTTNYHNATTHHSDQKSLIDRAIDELDKRYQSVYIRPSTLSCRPSPETEALLRTRFLDEDGRPNRKHKVMIALNLHVSQDVLPVITNAVLNSLRYLGVENVFVSIYENGSWDHTPEGLAHLGAVLTGLGVGHHIRSAKEETIWLGVDRIELLSAYRNLALSPLHAADKYLNGLTELMFINDVFLCTQDILEVIWERHFQNAHASCGTDWKESQPLLGQYGSWPWNEKKKTSVQETEEKKSVYLYDSWVARSLSGRTLRPRLDLLGHVRDPYGVIFDQETDTRYRQRLRETLAVPVYSCWNGIIALSPEPFRGPQGLRFRAADRAECPSSECQLLAKDFWSLGLRKWVIVPKVAVSYSQDIYYSRALVNGSNRDHRPASLPLQHTHLSPQASSEKILWDQYSGPDTVVCWPDMYKFHIDFEWNHVLESPYNPKLLNSSSQPPRGQME